MCILLCLGQTKLFQSLFCQEFSECIFNLYFMECHQLIRNCSIVFCKAYISCLKVTVWTLKAVKLIITDRPGDFSCPVRTEVEEDDRIIFFDHSSRLSIFRDNSRQNELIIYFLFVGIRNCIHGRIFHYSFSHDKGFVCFLHTVPAIVTVHCIVTSGNSGYLAYTDLFHLCFQFFYESLSGSRCRITSV